MGKGVAAIAGPLLAPTPAVDDREPSSTLTVAEYALFTQVANPRRVEAGESCSAAATWARRCMWSRMARSNWTSATTWSASDWGHANSWASSAC